MLALWGAWLLAGMTLVARQQAAGAQRLDPAVARWLASLSPGTGTPLAVRLAGPPDCPCATRAWEDLAGAMGGERGEIRVLTGAHALPPGVEVAILGADGQLRYAGALAPDPYLCGHSGRTPLSAWLPALLQSRSPLYLPAADRCAC